MTKNICCYCKKEYVAKKRGDHVFPKGLGGEDVYMDCVCSECNNYFSGLERELIQKSVIGLMRSVEGITGYKKSEFGTTPFKAQLLLMPDEAERYIYEVRQNYEMKVDVRPQIILFEGRLYLEGDTHEGIKVMLQTFNSWKTKSKLIVLPAPDSKDNPVRILQIDTSDTGYSYIELQQPKSTKGAINVLLMPPDHKLSQALSPRLFIDDDLMLRIRARSETEALQLVKVILREAANKSPFDSYKTTLPEQPIVYVGFNFDPFKTEQALVKIGLNSLLHYFPNAKKSNSLDGAISFVMNGKPHIYREVEEKNSLKDVIDAHTIFFYQSAQFLHVRIGLFNGNFVFSFVIPNLEVMPVGQYCRLVIDYLQKVNRFESQSDYFHSFTNN